MKQAIDNLAAADSRLARRQKPIPVAAASGSVPSFKLHFYVYNRSSDTQRNSEQHQRHSADCWLRVHQTEKPKRSPAVYGQRLRNFDAVSDFLSGLSLQRRFGEISGTGGNSHNLLRHFADTHGAGGGDCADDFCDVRSRVEGEFQPAQENRSLDVADLAVCFSDGRGGVPDALPLVSGAITGRLFLAAERVPQKENMVWRLFAETGCQNVLRHHVSRHAPAKSEVGVIVGESFFVDFIRDKHSIGIQQTAKPVRKQFMAFRV